jgi:hypothetical protein
MRRRYLALALPIGLMTFTSCGSGTALLNSAGTGASETVLTRAASSRPSIGLSKATLSRRRLESGGGPVHVGARVTLKALPPEAVTLIAQAKDGRKAVVATRGMVRGEGNVWKTAEPGLALPQNLSAKAASFTIVVVATTPGPPTIKKSLKAGTVSVAKNQTDGSQPPPPPTF